MKRFLLLFLLFSVSVQIFQDYFEVLSDAAITIEDPENDEKYDSEDYFFEEISNIDFKYHLQYSRVILFSFREIRFKKPHFSIFSPPPEAFTT